MAEGAPAVRALSCPSCGGTVELRAAGYTMSVGCQYCGSPQELTFDHVVPRAQGGRTTWENVATACAPCNLRKGGRTPRQAGMHIARWPERPTSWQLQDHGRAFPPGYLHESWRDYLYWDVELDA